MITDSTIQSVEPQADGRSYVTEALTYDNGDVVVVTYLAGPRDNLQANLALRVDNLNQVDADASQADDEAKQSVKDTIASMDADQLAAVTALAKAAADGKVSDVAAAIDDGTITPQEVLDQAATVLNPAPVDPKGAGVLDGSQVR